MSALQPGLCSVTFRALECERIVALAAEAGLTHVEWGGDRHVPSGDLRRAAEVAALCAAHAIGIVSYGSYFEVGAAPSGEFDRVAATALALGARGVRVWAGRRGVDASAVSGDERDRTIAALREVCAIGAAAGLEVYLEFHRGTLTGTLASTLDLLQRAEHPALRTYWQPRPGIGVEEALREIAALRAYLAHLHVFSWTPAGERLPLAAGAALWQPVLAAVSRLGDPGAAGRCAYLEFVAGDEPAAFDRDAQTLHEWLAHANDRHHAALGSA